MKKIIAVLLVISLFATVFVGCSDSNLTDTLPNPNDTGNPPTDGEKTDSGTYKWVSSEILCSEEIETNDALPDKTATIFGSPHTLKYEDTYKKKTHLHNSVSYEDDLCFASFDSVTGALVYYDADDAGQNRAYQSEVNERSSEAEFLAYAKKLVSQYSSVEGCEVEISTEIYEYDAPSGNYRSRRTIDGYVNNTENVSDFYAIYSFTFYKTIDGIRRLDTNRIEINNTGEVHRAVFNRQDELYADFTDVKIDMEQAERLAKEGLKQFIPNPSTVEIDPWVVATNDGMLLLDLNVFVSFGGGTSGYDYILLLSDTNES